MNGVLCYLNGERLPANQATFLAWDAGLVWGATASEQLRTFDGKLFQADAHWRRWSRSLQALGIRESIDLEALARKAQDLVAHNHALLKPGSDLGLAALATPGAYEGFSRFSDSSIHDGPTTLLHTYELPFAKFASEYRDGAHLMVSSHRQVPAECWSPQVKHRSRLHYFLADQEARRRSPGSRALLLDHEGFVNETPTANVLGYWAKAKEVGGPKSDKTLPGISLGFVRELIAREGWNYFERDLTVEELCTADEVWLTSTPFCLLPCARIEDRAIGSGAPGAAFERIIRAWSEMVGVDFVSQALQTDRQAPPRPSAPLA